jgi:hypothetical protein
MSGPSLSTKLQIVFVAQAVFALGLIFYVSQTLLRHLQFDVPQLIADYFVQLIAIIVPLVMFLLSFLALRSPRLAIQALVVARCSVARLSSCRAIPGVGAITHGLRRGRRLGRTPLHRRFCSGCAGLPRSRGRLLPPPRCHTS